MKNRYVITGGLGNQLFQYAAAISLESKVSSQIELEMRLGKPRSTNGIPDLEYFELKDTKIRTNWSSILNRALGLSLRNNLIQPSQRRIPFSRKMTQRVLSALGSLIMKKPTLLHSPSNLGWDLNFTSGHGYRLVIGYFQSYKYATSSQSTFETLRGLKLKKESPQVLKYRELSILQSPLVVHVRRGDYVGEALFGILAPEYYQDTIKSAYSTGRYKKIWLFSDDFVEAATCIPEELVGEVIQIDEIDNSPASTLQVMRFGKGYVIANSSYSWWGAFLSVNLDPEVHAPSPWFKGMPSPNEILPPSWVCHKSIFC
jgi:hypothetical protein